MLSTPEYRAYLEIQDDHRKLKELLARIDGLLAAQNASETEVTDLLALLGDVLVKHFALEEKDSYFGDALTHAPRLVAKANELMNQHPKMAWKAQQLGQSTTDQCGSAQWWQETRLRFRQFMRELIEHETCENRLLQEAYTSDVGTSD